MIAPSRILAAIRGIALITDQAAEPTAPKRRPKILGLSSVTSPFSSTVVVSFMNIPAILVGNVSNHPSILSGSSLAKRSIVLGNSSAKAVMRSGIAVKYSVASRI